jgi:uncharacterized damage-inducible protein DinB
MISDITTNDLLEYTDWERAQWMEWMRPHGVAVLEVGAGPHGDGRFTKVGDLVKHIFSAEKRYVERFSNRPLTDPATIPLANLEGLFQFGQRSRRELREFIQSFTAEDGDRPVEFQIMNRSLSASPRKIVAHVLMHEIRHWAQIGTLLRLNGLKVDFHDFLFSPVMDSKTRPQVT